MPTLTNTQRQYLRKQAHELKPITQIGKHGLSEPLIGAIDQALRAHELIKVKFLEFQDQRQELSRELADATGSELVALIGNIAILYRENPNPEERKVALPAGW